MTTQSKQHKTHTENQNQNNKQAQKRELPKDEDVNQNNTKTQHKTQHKKAQPAQKVKTQALKYSGISTSNVRFREAGINSPKTNKSLCQNKSKTIPIIYIILTTEANKQKTKNK